MAERIVIRNGDKTYSIRPPDQQNVVGALLADDATNIGFVFVAKTEKKDEVMNLHTSLDAVLNDPKKATVDRKVANMTVDFELCLQPEVEVVGPEKLVSI